MDYILFNSKIYVDLYRLIPYSFIIYCYLNNVTELPDYGNELGMFDLNNYILNHSDIENLVNDLGVININDKGIRDKLAFDTGCSIKTIQEGEIYLGTDEHGLDVYCTLDEKYGAIQRNNVCLILKFRTIKKQGYKCGIEDKLKIGRAKVGLAGVDIKINAFNDRIYSSNNCIGLMLDLHDILFKVTLSGKDKLYLKNISLHSIKINDINDCRFNSLKWCNIRELMDVGLTVTECKRIHMENILNSTIKINNSGGIDLAFIRHSTIKVDRLNSIDTYSLLYTSIEVSEPVEVGDMLRLAMGAKKSTDKALFMGHVTLSLLGGGEISEIVDFLSKWEVVDTLEVKLPEDEFRHIVTNYPEFACKVNSIG